jgi:UDP-GlcNAc:undecaprenyl-phosphate/decaprenyl-phosphate GlcNAc-1-phosphate transferase
MPQILLLFTTALLFSILATPLVRQVALRIGLVDAPNARKIHGTPLPLLGGAAIYLGFMVALILFGDRFYIRELVSIFLGATLVALFGLADDRWGLHAYLKLGGQFLAGLILIIGGTHVQLFQGQSEWANYAITLFWVVGITNAFNLIDNMDGLSGGVATVAAAFFLLLSAMSGQYLVPVLAFYAITLTPARLSWAILVHSFWAFCWPLLPSSYAFLPMYPQLHGWCQSVCWRCLSLIPHL